MVNYRIAVLGNWHLAFTTAAVLSHVGHRVALIDLNGKSPGRTSSNFPRPPVNEPGLPEMIDACSNATRLDYIVGNEGWTADAIWLAIDTPVSERDEPNVGPLIEAISQVLSSRSKPQVLIVSSQIPIGFSRELQEKFKVPVVYVPENLRLGKGIETFLRADRTVIGADSEQSRNWVKELLKEFQTEFILCGLETSEMVKHATNVFLATSISFANELARIGETFGVESQVVAKALKADRRIGPAAYVAPGLGFAGGTLPRDLRVLQKIGREKSIPTRLLDAVLAVNQETTAAITEIVLQQTESLGRAPEVLILGYTYKADTNTLRRSLSVDIASRLILSRAGSQPCRVWGFDPIMNSEDLTELKGLILHCNTLGNTSGNTLGECQVKPDVVLLMTARPVFKTLKWGGIAKKDGTRTLVLDTQNFLDGKQITESGLDFKPLWSPIQTPKL